MENIIDNQKSDNQKSDNQSNDNENNDNENNDNENKEQCCNKKHCGVNKLSINEMSNIYLINSLSVVIEKGCGYEFLIYLNEYSTLIDLYRYVEQFYSHCNENKVIYVDHDRMELIPRSEERIKDFIYKNKIKPDNPSMKYKINYKFYLSFI